MIERDGDHHGELDRPQKTQPLVPILLARLQCDLRCIRKLLVESGRMLQHEPVDRPVFSDRLPVGFEVALGQLHAAVFEEPGAFIEWQKVELLDDELRNDPREPDRFQVRERIDSGKRNVRNAGFTHRFLLYFDPHH